MKSQGLTDENTKCNLIEELLIQKLLIDQAELDSLEVTEDQINSEIDRRIEILTEQLGNESKFEAFYGKKIIEIKKEWYIPVKEQLLAEQMQNKVVKDVEASPNDVKKFFKNLPEDSLPVINQQVEVSQVVISPPVDFSQKKELRDKLNEIRDRVIAGESFSKLAVMYSNDPGTSSKGGELGYLSRSDLVTEFASAAFRLKPGEVSRVVETEFGFHIIQLIDQKGEKVNVRHILLVPNVTPEDLKKAKLRIDTIYNYLLQDSLKFEDAAVKFSDDDNTKNSGGILFNPYTGSSKFDIKQLEPNVAFAIKDLKVGEISQPFISYDDRCRQVYKIVKLDSFTDAHIATLTGDYDLIKNMAVEEKREKVFEEWVVNKQKTTFIKIEAPYNNCNFQTGNWFVQ